MADVTTEHADYAANSAQWKLVEDAAAGEAKVKAARETYLPRPNPNDKTAEACSRYDQYIARAVYYNATGRTLRTLVGMAFFRDPETELPPEVEAGAEDITGSGVTLNQQAQATLAEVLKTGRAGLLADFPTVADPARTSVLVQRVDGVRPTLTSYAAADIINWRVSKIGARTVLSMVVLRETHDVVDGFETKAEPQYRVLKLDETGLYIVEIWRQVAVEGKDGKQWKVAETALPLNGTGQRWTEIPFTFCGAQNNDVTVDDAPMLDIGTLNIAHYRNSADYEDSVFFCGQPQFYIAGLTEEWRDTLYKQGAYVGSRAIMSLPVGGSAGILQAEPNTLAHGAMEQKEQQMAALGARLLISTQQVKTATQQNSEDSVAQSVLSLACNNVSAAYEKSLTWYASFAKSTGTITFSLHTDFATRVIDPTELSALVQLVQAGKLPESDLWTRLRAVGVIDPAKDDDAIREELSQETPPTDSTGTGAEDDQTQQAA